MIARAAVLSAVVVAAGALVLAEPATRSVASVGTVSFSTSPALFPAFDPAVSDYVVRCATGTPVQVSVSNSDGTDTTTTVSVDGQAPQNGAFVAPVDLALGQAFAVTVTQGATAKTYHVRCLADGFPTWTVERPGTTQAEYYVVAPSLFTSTPSGYVILYDTNGVPIWWTLAPATHTPVDAKVTANGDILWTENAFTAEGFKAEERRLDGSIIDDTIAPDGYLSDIHDVQRLANGNYLVIGDYERCCYDLSGHGGPASASILDYVIQEVTPGGAAVWTWDSADHVGVDEVAAQFWSFIVSTGTPYDTLQMNSVWKDAAGDLLVSFRHEDAVYKITNPQATTNPGSIIWKLGGSSPTVEPGTGLTILNDPIFTAGGGFGGQHYARYYDPSDGNVYVTLQDNGTNLGRPPRGVRYRIDAGAGTATLVEDVRDTAAPGLTSFCCGSAGELPGGDWVMSWGAGQSVMELTSAGTRVFVLTFVGSSYRADAVLPGVLTREALRAGMDAQYPPGDADGDGVPNAIDNCPSVANSDQANSRPNLIDLRVYGKLFDDTTVLNSTLLGDICNPDIDGDGLSNTTETAGPPCATASAPTDPLKLDTDGDGFTDRAECMLETDPASATSKPLINYGVYDTDRDGLPDALEATLGTDPTKVDTDGDKLNDGVEFLYYGSNPLNANTDTDICSDGKEAASLNEDTTVNSTDQLIVAQSFGPQGGPTYVLDFDVNRDRKINSTDLLIQAKAYGSC